MSEPKRTDSVPAPGPSGDADRAARIEQLLLSGLDCYFAGQYKHAINVWTRVAFLERGHGRARAYIERARSAMAERQRESEELLHQGVAAYNEGDVAAARDLLTQAADGGGSADEAMLFLQRLNRVTPNASLRERETARASSGHVHGLPREHRPTGRRWVIPALAAAALVGGIALGAAPLVSWLTDVPGASPSGLPRGAAVEPLPVVRSADTALARARALHAGGHVRDALRALERIDVGDPLRAEADRVRAEIQRDLLGTATLDVGTSYAETSR